MFTWHEWKHNEYRTKPVAAKKPKVKQWRRLRPHPRYEYEWRHEPQNTSKWGEIREGNVEVDSVVEGQKSTGSTSGASSAYDVLGYGPFRTNCDRYREDTGQVPSFVALSLQVHEARIAIRY